AAEKSSVLPRVHIGISGEFYFGTSGENSRGIDRYRYDCKITYLSVHLEHKFYECSSIFVIERIRVNTPFLTL
ncbi:hypothetical protein, partial [Rhizobium rhizogenes]|uniref:hypothetical protein n=1 Tax=Rhizobium rhizogenes TaxID=359 RepID=UPI001AEE4EB5